MIHRRAGAANPAGSSAVIRQAQRQAEATRGEAILPRHERDFIPQVERFARESYTDPAMPTRAEMLELVQAHVGLEDRMDAAIWIQRDAPDGWLVELLPDLPADRHPGRPVQFNAGRTFRHELNLIAANAEDLRAAARTRSSLPGSPTARFCTARRPRASS
jgi:hypothetical protein